MRWLQLCDLHLGIQNEVQQVAMSQLVDAIENYIGEDPLDAVIIAGDIAYSGKQEEYDAVIRDVILPLRKIPSISKAKFISVPGNHDLDCDVSLPIIWEGLGSRRQEDFWNSSVKGCLIRHDRAQSFCDYAKFLETENLSGPNPLEEIGSVVKFGETNSTLFVLLNTALFSDRDFSDDEEKGKSPLPVQTLRLLAKQKDEHSKLIVVGHHPPSWFEIQSKTQFLSALTDLGAIYIHGHEHKIEVTFGPSALRTLGFGSSYPARLDSKSPQPYTSTFAVCVLEEQLHVKFISWDATNGTWRPLTNIPSDIRDSSNILENGFSIPVPSTQAQIASSIRSREPIFSEQKPTLEPPIWVSGEEPDDWVSLLVNIGLIEQPDLITNEDPNLVSLHSRFIARNSNGNHLIHAASAETAAITYEHVERANTQLDTLQLNSCIIATFGKVTIAARNLANSLTRSKSFKIFDGAAISEKLANLPLFPKCKAIFSSLDGKVSYTPLVIKGGLAVLIVDSIQNNWFSIVDKAGNVLPESNELVAILREKFGRLNHLIYRSPAGTYGDIPSDVQPAVFKTSEYLKRCVDLFDTVKYAGLASIGIRMPVESLRRVYVPTSANVEQQQSAVEATERAIDELVEALSLDEHQREQLTRQMKAKYGSQKTSEVGAAGNLYQNFSNVLILGDPGSGKSCFVRSEVMNYCLQRKGDDSDWYSSHIPVYLPLAEFSHSIDFPNDILDQCALHAQGQSLDIDRAQIEVLLSRGRIAFFFDGLDEVGSISVRQMVLNEVTELVEKYASLGNRFVLTSRPAAVRDVSLPKELARISLQGLTDIEIELLVNRLFEARHEEGKPLKKSDKQVINNILQDCKATPGIRRLARNPLLLTLLVIVYENSGSFAARRHLIYSQAIKTLVSVRHRQIRRPMVSESDLRVRLGKLAVAIFRGETNALPTRSDAINIMLGDESCERTDGNDFIQEVAENTGLLIVHPRTENIGSDLVSFMHYSFLEYYTSVGFLDGSIGFDKIAQLALNQRWREVVTLMFGILSEQDDITNKVEVLCKGAGHADSITASRLLLSLDCALECDVPPEATQLFLSKQICNNLTSGAGLAVSDVREEIGERVKLLLESTDSRYFRRMILTGIQSANPVVAAAFIELAATIGDYCNEDELVIEKISEAFSRDNEFLTLSIVNAMRELTALRTKHNLENLRKVLTRGGIVERTAALQLLEEHVALTVDLESELVNILFANHTVLAGASARCILRGKLFRKESYLDFGIFDRALQEVISGDKAGGVLSGSVELPREQLEEWIFSSNDRLRERGFRSLVVVQTDPVYVHDILFKSLKTEKDSNVVSAILYALASYPGAVQAASLAETDMVCGLMRSKFANVRRAVARALRAFPTMDVVTNALIERFQKMRRNYTSETREIIRGITEHAMRDSACRSVLVDEIRRILRGNLPRWTKKNCALVADLLVACDQIGMDSDSTDAKIVMNVIKDYRVPVTIKRLAMKLYGQICETDSYNIRAIASEFGSHDPNRRIAAYRAGRKLLQRCRARLESVQLIISALGETRAELLRSWNRELGVYKNTFDEPALREIRNFLVDIEMTLSAYNEFSERITTVAFLQEIQ